MASLPEDDPFDHIDPIRPREGEPNPEPAPTYAIAFPWRSARARWRARRV
jgi:hypothetical protein